MKYLYIFFIFFFISCSIKDLQTNQKNKIINLSKDISYERENILNQIKQPGEKKLNINNLFEITVPQNIEIITIDQILYINRDYSQYLLGNYIGIIYRNKYFLLRVNCYGNINKSFLNEEESYNLQKIVTPFGNQITELRKNYVSTSLMNKNNIKLSRFVSHWGTSWSSDYFGLYFELPDKEFNECEISIYNIWGTFSKSNLFELNEANYKTISLSEGGIIKEIIQDLDFIVNSITYSISNDSIKILLGNIGKEEIEDQFIFPSIDNLRMRRKPSLESEFVGYMKDELYQIITIGDYEEIDGIKGNWILITPFRNNDVSWVFNGYTRKATDEEIDKYFGG